MAKTPARKSKAKTSNDALALVLAKPPSALVTKKIAKPKTKMFIKRSDRGA
jgi:hypothetical protein